MAIKQYQYITLADSKIYFVLENLVLDGTNYLYLMEKDHVDHLGFYKEINAGDKINIVLVEDKLELSKIQVAFLNKMKETIENRNH